MKIQEIRNFLNDVNFDTPDTIEYQTAIIILSILSGCKQDYRSLMEFTRLTKLDVIYTLRRLTELEVLVEGQIDLDWDGKDDLGLIISLSLIGLMVVNKVHRAKI